MAVITQAPAPTAVAAPVLGAPVVGAPVVGAPVVGAPATVHTAGVSDRNVTGSPDDARARSGTRAPACAPGGGGKETS